MTAPHVLILVLGDAGRSPRMQYHALSLLQSGCDVTLCGYGGNRLIEPLEQQIEQGSSPSPLFTFCPLPANPKHPIFNAVKPLKAVFQFLALLAVLLFRRPRPDVLLLQIPPAIPTMLTALFVCSVRRTRLVFDWHNFGHTLMPSGPLQALAKVYETFLAPLADANLCVTKAMQGVLKEAYRGTRATVFYDRPKADVFAGRTGPREGAVLLGKLMEGEGGTGEFDASCVCVRTCLEGIVERMEASRGATTSGIGSNAAGPSPGCKITARSAPGGSVRRRTTTMKMKTTALQDTKRKNDAVLVVSSTSWTWDEDFSILLEGMVEYDARATKDPALPAVLLYVTGKGPLKQHYTEKIAALELSHVAIRTAWLEPADYPRLLGCADLGVSLHASSSGVDLPMKIVDMFGAQTPVAALAYPCLADEMVTEGENGVVFVTATELCDKLVRLLQDDWAELKRMQRYVCKHGYGDWDDEWNRKAKDVILGRGRKDQLY